MDGPEIDTSSPDQNERLAEIIQEKKQLKEQLANVLGEAFDSIAARIKELEGEELAIREKGFQAEQPQSKPMFKANEDFLG